MKKKGFAVIVTTIILRLAARGEAVAGEIAVIKIPTAGGTMVTNAHVSQKEGFIEVAGRVSRFFPLHMPGHVDIFVYGPEGSLLGRTAARWPWGSPRWQSRNRGWQNLTVSPNYPKMPQGNSMIRIFRNKKSLSLLFVLTYLLIGSGIGNAMLWCQESEAFSHLEYNLAGKCQHVCHPAEESHENLGRTTLSPPSWPSAADCRDTQVSLFHTPAPEGNNLPANPVSPGSFLFHLHPVNHLAVSSLARLNLVTQPPPSQALISLRTVVLLN